MVRILVVGIGGVGGYIGGLLANYYAGNPEVEILFLARGQHLELIRKRGLMLHHHHGFVQPSPALASDDPAQIGPVDYIILCTKSYDLETSINQLFPCISDGTVILPLLNGVNIVEQLCLLLPEAEIWQGCAYMVSRLEAPGVVRENSGGKASFAWGNPNGENEKTRRFNEIILAANIPAKWEPDMEAVLWKKYIFISVVATLTSYLNCGIGAFLEQEQGQVLMHELLDEVISLAQKKNVIHDPEIKEKTLHSIRSMPYSSTSSMHADFSNGKRTELETLTGYVVHEASRIGLAVPTFSKLYRALLEKSAPSA
jgi:2-dehydropantoate 2-reductase